MKVSKKLAEITNPFNAKATLKNYTDMVEVIGELVRETALHYIKNTLEEVDERFFNSDSRKRNFSVKDKRSRTLITMYGQMTFTRRIYQSKDDGSYYTHVDRKMGLPRYDRYDPTVKARIVEEYADNNSMIKVGETIGELIYSTFSTKKERKNFNISRQTVHNIVKDAPKLMPNIDRIESTPQTLYIMADEKFISAQHNDHKKLMVKQLVLFEGINSHSKRTELQKKLVFSRKSTTIWTEFLNHLDTIYDLEKVEKIVVMGDGASWIKQGRFELPNTEFHLDTFHGLQAVNHMTRDEDFLDDIYNTIFTNNRNEFIL